MLIPLELTIPNESIQLLVVPRRIKMKETRFENIFNHDKFACANPRDVEVIDGVQYLIVHRQDNNRPQLMRKDALKKIENK